jgi:hypothetical protein
VQNDVFPCLKPVITTKTPRVRPDRNRGHFANAALAWKSDLEWRERKQGSVMNTAAGYCGQWSPRVLIRALLSQQHSESYNNIANKRLTTSIANVAVNVNSTSK